MPERNDEQFESYLKSFRPVDPEPLPLHTKTHSVSARRRSVLAISAVACLAAVALVFIVLSRSPESTNEQAVSNPFSDARTFSASRDAESIDLPKLALTKLALDDHHAFDEFMTDKVQSQFPSMKSEQSALRVLAKE
jgi:hypothetical protein